MLVSLEFDLIAVVIGLALFEGGRGVRLAALIFTAHFAVYVMAMAAIIPDSETLRLVNAIQIAGLPVFAWVAWRYRARWSLALLILQALLVAVWQITTLHNGLQDLPHRLVFFSLDAAKAGCLGWAAARRWLAAPHQPPAAGQPDLDLYETARARWPGKL
ncbi:MAG: hypothetical protein JWP35_606 [Caulobacter sp.]|nr:hypothetical protein [Caulobacter sp.]